MACPKCGCKTTYPYGRDDGSDMVIEDDERDRCAACGHVFYIEDHTPEDDDLQDAQRCN